MVALNCCWLAPLMMSASLEMLSTGLARPGLEIEQYYRTMFRAEQHEVTVTYQFEQRIIVGAGSGEGMRCFTNQILDYRESRIGHRDSVTTESLP